VKVVGAKLDDSDYERFETFCIDEGLSKSEILRGLIKQYCNDCEDFSDEDNQLATQDLEVKPWHNIAVKGYEYTILQLLKGILLCPICLVIKTRCGSNFGKKILLRYVNES